MLRRGHDIVPVIGARRRDRLAETLGALDVKLGTDELAAIGRTAPDGAVTGTRYATQQMASLDSEKA